MHRRRPVSKTGSHEPGSLPPRIRTADGRTGAIDRCTGFARTRETAPPESWTTAFRMGRSECPWMKRQNAILRTRSFRVALSFLFFSVMIGTVEAQAQLIEFDDLSLPPSLDGFNITHDASTGLDWLDLTVTEGRTFDDIVGLDGSDELAPGGDFEGFRHATALEVHGWTAAGQLDSLYKSFGFASSFSSIAGYPPAREFLSYLGCSPTSNCGALGFIQGVCVDDLTMSSPRWGKAEALVSQGWNMGSVGGCSNSAPVRSHGTNGHTYAYGHYLVRVPEPGFGASLLSGIALLMGTHARRNRRAVTTRRALAWAHHDR